MKVAIILSLLVVAAMAAPQKRTSDDVQIIEYNNDNPGDGNYNFNFKTSDGTSRQEKGELRKIGEEFGQAVTGSITWTDADGQTFTLNYIADENGFQPQGAHLPK